MSQATPSSQGLACVRGPQEDDRRFQRDGAAAGADVEQGDDAAALGAHVGDDGPRVRRRERELHAEEHPRGAAAAVQGRDRGEAHWRRYCKCSSQAVLST